MNTGPGVREIRLHDTRAGQLAALEPRDPGRVSVYACGPTVYARIHVGNARPFVVFSWLKRFLEHEGLPTTLAVNVTDVNDKIYDAARAAGRPSGDLAREMTDHYFADTDALGLGRPDHEPLASETIEPIKDLISALIDRGHAYASGGDVFFRVRTDEQYGSLSHRTVEDMDQGEGVEGADRKEDPLDFALWKGRKPDEDTAWEAPWGAGRPGWHIECSAMAEDLLGLEFDVHGGGSDLLFPHHENEAAQTRAGRGRELARIWMHNGMLQMKDEKMSKSLGNIAPLHQAVEEVGRDALLMLFANAHYRQPMAYTAEAIEQARASVARIREAARRLRQGDSPGDLEPFRERFFDELADDFNTHGGLAAIFEWVREANRRADAGDAPGDAHLREMLGVLGLENLLEADGDGPDPDAVAMLERREQARAAGDYAEADRLRDELLAAGWQVRDGPSGPELVRAS
jgi:cysteinyl-tRNA synthetase